MEYVKPEYEQRLHDLADVLATPDRYGRVALAPLVELPLPELARVYDFPAGDSAE